jgi:hypothetical protein
MGDTNEVIDESQSADHLGGGRQEGGDTQVVHAWGSFMFCSRRERERQSEHMQSFSPSMVSNFG